MPQLEEIDGDLCIGTLRFSQSRCAVWIGRTEIPLTRRDVLLIALMLRHVGKIVTREAMIEAAWGTEFDGSERAVDVHLSRLRRRVFDQPGCPLRIKSVRGMGYKITLTAGTAAPNKPVEKESATWSAHGLRPRVLVVDDNTITRMAAARILSKLGCLVDTAENGQIAVGMVGQAEFDVIFMDVEMPVLDGYGATRALRQSLSLNRQPVIIAMTAHCLPEDRETCWAAGMDDFLAKPVTRQALMALLERWSAAEATPRDHAADLPPVIDEDDLWHLLDHDRHLLDEMVTAFHADWALTLRELQTAIKTEEALVVATLAHRLVDTLLSFAAPRATLAARQLENIGRFGLSDRAMAQFEALTTEIDTLRVELEQLCRVSTPA